MARAIEGAQDWSIEPLLKDITTFTSHFESVDFYFIPKILNLVAHICSNSIYSRAVGSFIPIFHVSLLLV